MSDRKNLKLSGDTYQILKEHKAEYETWDGFFRRLVSAQEQREQEDKEALGKSLAGLDPESGSDMDI